MEIALCLRPDETRPVALRQNLTKFWRRASLPFVCHHRWSEQLSYFFHLPWKTAVSSLSLYKNTPGFVILTLLNLVHMIAVMKVPTWCMAYLNHNALVWGSFLNLLLNHRYLCFYYCGCKKKQIVVWRDFNSSSLCCFSILTCLTHLSVWSRTSLGVMEDRACSSVERPPAPSEWSRTDVSTVMLAWESCFFLLFIVKYKSAYRTKRNVQRWKKDVPLRPLRLFEAPDVTLPGVSCSGSSYSSASSLTMSWDVGVRV